MSTTKKIAQNTAIQIVGKTISTLLGLVAIGIMTRYLGKEQFGWYITAISFLQFIGILIDFGMTPVTAQMMSSEEGDKQKLFGNLLGFRFATAVIFLGIAPLIALFFPYPTEVKLAISFSTFSFLGVAMNQVFVGFYQTKMKMHLQAIGEITSRIALVASLLLIMKLGAGYLWIMGAVTLAGIIFTIVLWLFAQKEISTRLRFDMDIWKTIIKKSWPIAISIIFNVVYLRGDVLLLSLFRDQGEVGLYGAAYRVLDVVGQTAMMLMGVLLPLLAYAWSKNMKEEFKKRYQQSFDAMMLFAVPMTAGIIVLATPIMKLVAGEEFEGAGNILAILAIAVFGVFVGAVFGHTAVAIDKQKQTMWIYISNAALSLTAYLILIPRFGMYGAAWTTVFSEIYAGLLLFLIIRHYTKQPLKLKTFGKILFASILMAGGIAQFPTYNIALLIGIGIVIYGSTLFATGAISKETVQEILKKD